MRDIVLICMACELVLLAGAILAGAPIGAMLRGAASRGTNSVVLCSLAVGSWVLAGLAINGVVARLPGGGQFASGLLRIADVDFNLVVFVPMILVSLAIGYLLTLSLIAASRGRALSECVRAATRLSVR